MSSLKSSYFDTYLLLWLGFLDERLELARNGSNCVEEVEFQIVKGLGFPGKIRNYHVHHAV